MREGLPDVPTMSKWLSEVTPPNSRIGFDPQQLPFNSVTSMQQDLDASISDPSARRLITPIAGGNLIDSVWSDRPSRPSDPIRAVPVETFAGLTWEQKLDALRASLKSKNTSAVVLFQLDEIAWLFNLRGADISCNPVFFSYAIVTMDEVDLFVDWQRGQNSIDLGQYLKSPSHKVSFRWHQTYLFFVWQIVEVGVDSYLGESSRLC